MEYEIASSIRCNRQETDSEIALHISHLAADGDESALLAYDAIAEYLSDGLANIFNILDPEAIILSADLWIVCLPSSKECRRS